MFDGNPSNQIIPEYRLRGENAAYRSRLHDYANSPAYEAHFRASIDAKNIQKTIAPFLEEAECHAAIVVTPDNILDALQKRLSSELHKKIPVLQIIAMEQGLQETFRWKISGLDEPQIRLFKDGRSFANCCVNFLFINTLTYEVLCNKNIKKVDNLLSRIIFHEAGHLIEEGGLSNILKFEINYNLRNSFPKRHYRECFAESMSALLLLFTGTSTDMVLFEIFKSSNVFRSSLEKDYPAWSNSSKPDFEEKAIYETTRAMLVACEYVHWQPMDMEQIIRAAHYGACYGGLRKDDYDCILKTGEISAALQEDIEARIPRYLKDLVRNMYDRYLKLPVAAPDPYAAGGIDSMIALSRLSVDQRIDDKDFFAIHEKSFNQWVIKYSSLVRAIEERESAKKIVITDPARVAERLTQGFSSDQVPTELIDADSDTGGNMVPPILGAQVELQHDPMSSAPPRRRRSR